MLASKLAKIVGIATFSILASASCGSNAQQYPFAEVLQYRANNPIEDRFCLTQLNSIKGFTASVFDGHGGDLVSQYASKHLNKCLEDRLAKNKNAGLSIEANVEKSLIQAYKDVQDSFFAIFKQNLRNKAYLTVGSCALTAVVLKDKLIIANAGDCQGVLLSPKEAAMTNLRLNAGQPFEQARLVRQFPGQSDIFVCKAACYLKNRLQPTRSFGDYYLKYKQYNFTNIKYFTGPYLTSQPLITKFALNQQHQNLILATDGLWDQMDARQIHSIYKKGRSKLGETVFSRAIQFILERNNLKNKQSLDKIDYRRDMHDDITIVNLDLEQLRKLL